MATTPPNPGLVAARPAESLTIVGAIAFLIARALGVDNDTTMTALTMVIAFTPAAITWLVGILSPAKPEITEKPGDSVAEELAELNKTLREAVAAKPAPEPTEAGAVEAGDLVGAVERVLAAREAEREKRETMSDLAEALVGEFRQGVRAFSEAPEGTSRPAG